MAKCGRAQYSSSTCGAAALGHLLAIFKSHGSHVKVARRLNFFVIALARPCYIIVPFSQRARTA